MTRAWDDPAADVIADLAAIKRQVMADTGYRAYYSPEAVHLLLEREFRRGTPRSWPTRWGRKVFDGVCVRLQPFATWRKHLYKPAGPAGNLCRRCHVMSLARPHVRDRRLKAIMDRQRWKMMELSANPFDARLAAADQAMKDRLFIVDDPEREAMNRRDGDPWP